MKIKWQQRLKESQPDIAMKHFKAYHAVCADSILHFINHHVITFDPRLESGRELPLELFPKQEEYIRWLWARYIAKEEGVVSKTRGCGFSWMNAAFAVYVMIFLPAFTVSFYSYKEVEVDRLDNIDSLLEKCNFIINRLPPVFHQGIDRKLMQITNLRNGSVIAGKSGSSPGRGGRSSVYFIDEAAFFERDEHVEAAVSRNADCRIWGSTFNGTANLFYRKATSSLANVFTIDWFEIPLYTKEWFDREKAKAEAEGTLHIFAQEVLRDASASVESVVIPGAWVQAAIRSDKKENGKIVAGFDPADGGRDTAGLTVMNGNELVYCEERGGEDAGDTTDVFFWKCVELGVSEFRYDVIGIGSGVKQRIKEIKASLPDDHPAQAIRIIPWNAGGKVVRPEEEDFAGISNFDMFDNSKAQAYWQARYDFLQTYRYVEGKDCDESRTVFFPMDRTPAMNKLITELSQPQHSHTKTGKTTIDKAPKGTKSPNMCESYILATAEVEPEWIGWSVV